MSNADDIFWRRFGAILVALIVFGVVVAFIARDIAGDSFRTAVNSPSAVAGRLAPEGSVRVGDPAASVAPETSTVMAAATAAATPAPSSAGPMDEGESVYNGACVACHAAGVAGAPKLEDEAAWAPRIALGQDALVASVVNGKGAMPAMGGNPSLTEDQVRAAVAWMMVKASPEGAAAAAPEQSAAGTLKETAKEVTQAAGATVEKAAEQVEAAAEKAAGKVEAAAEAAGEKVEAATQKAGEKVEAAAEKAREATAAAAATVASAPSAGKPGNEVYNLGCVACHATGAANAPKLTDKAAWETRAAAGMDALIASAVNGKGAMPAKGGIPTLTDADVGNAVRYMLDEAGVEPGS